MNDPIMLRSDTATLPTDDMIEAMRTAPLGDDVLRQDPTVNKLEALAARRMGKEAALFVASGTMGNLVSLMAHGGHGDEAIVDVEAHLYWSEQGGLCSIGGYMPRVVTSHDGLLDPADVEAAVRASNIHFPVPRLLCLENTHNRGGGRVVVPGLFRDLCAVARRHDLRIHLDGARIFNAAVAAGVDVTQFTEHVDSIQFCLSKGLSAPVGSMIAGSADFIGRARRARKRLGGGMRQAGVIAAAGIVALEKMVERLGDDHANAKRLAERIDEIPPLQVIMKPVETNMVFVEVSRLGRDAVTAAGELLQRSLAVSVYGPTTIRLVTNRMVDAADIDAAVGVIERYVGETQ